MNFRILLIPGHINLSSNVVFHLFHILVCAFFLPLGISLPLGWRNLIPNPTEKLSLEAVVRRWFLK